MMQKNESLKIGSGCINQVVQIPSENSISGKILYVSDPMVDSLYGETVKDQIKEVGQLKEENEKKETYLAPLMNLGSSLKVGDRH